MKLLGLIGNPLIHSFSKQYFQEKFAREKMSGWDYRLFPLDSIDLFPDLLKDHKELIGLNVTIPYKESVMKYLTTFSQEVLEIGAVNTISISRHPALILSAFNTDYYAFMESIKPYLLSNDRNALILGTGGSSKAIQYALKLLDISFTIVSRNPKENEITYEQIDIEMMEKHSLIINTTPVGMFPQIENYPAIPYNLLTKRHLLYDLIYNPDVTEFLKKGVERGCRVLNGLKMLQLQAEKSWEIWTNHR